MAIPAVATKLPVASELSWDIVLPIFGWRSFALPVNADEIPKGSRGCDTCQYLKKRWKVSQSLSTD